MNKLQEVKEALEHIKQLANVTCPQTAPEGYKGVFEIAEEALAKLEAYMVNDGWQPIESAPRDGQTIIAMEYFAGDDRLQECWQYHLTFYYASGDDGKWLNAADSGYTECYPDRWMPLPPIDKE